MLDFAKAAPPIGSTGEGTLDSPWFDEVEVELTGNDGNAFSIMAQVSRALRSHRVHAETISQYREESVSGDYDNLLRTAMRWVRVS